MFAIFLLLIWWVSCLRGDEQIMSGVNPQNKRTMELKVV